MEKMRILAIDDNTVNLATLEQELKSKYEVIPMISGRRAIKYLYREQVDLILLDVEMPIMDGIETLKEIRAQENGVTVPVIFLTAKKDKATVIDGAKLGIMDYITKPFKLGVLLSRVNALLRRTKSIRRNDTELISNGIKIDLLQTQVCKNGEQIELTAGEYKLLCLFMQNPNIVLTKDQILQRLWDCDANYIDSSTLTVYIRRLRMKVENNPSEPEMILTVRGMGYKWNENIGK